MTRSISIASVLSVALHAGVIAALALVFANFRFSVVDTLPVLSVDLTSSVAGKAQVDAPVEELHTEETLADMPAPRVPVSPETLTIAEEPPGDPQPVPEPQPANTAVPAAPQALPVIAEPVQSVQAQPATNKPAEAAASKHTQAPELVATVSPGARRAASVAMEATGVPAEYVDIGTREQKMLDRKLRKMFRDPKALARVESGIEWKHRGQLYSAQFERKPASSDTDLEHVVVKVSREEGGQTLSTELVMRRLAFSSFGQFVHRWDPRVQIHDDVIDGRFHANTDVALTYGRKVNPVFNGAVTIAGDSIRIDREQGFVRRTEMFRAGLQTNVREIPLPSAFMQLSDRPPEDAQVRIFEVDTRLRFFADGTYEWSSLDGNRVTRRERLGKPTQYLVARNKTTLQVSGTVNGKVLVYSPGQILIQGDLIYADDPRLNPKSEDFTGLVAEKFVEIAEADVTGPGDLEVHAAICARRGFRVRDYNTGGTDLLYLYGSLTVGTIDATEPRYRTRIEFDDRLETARPPAFPVTDRYETVSWDGQWQVGN